MVHAVHIVHDHGIVHRDLKPANFAQVYGKMKLIDFGISVKLINNEDYVTDQIVGTHNFMAPEALPDDPESSTVVKVRQDIF
jgi:serine/threonine-protein kinase TTK/MPS1